MFSVLMSVYEKENPKYLFLSLESIFNQTMPADELIIVKDGKLTEELNIVINKYKHQYSDIIKIIELETNVGLGKALQIGLEQCKYENIIRMDSDDICINTRFERLMSVLTNTSEVSMVGSNAIEFESSIEDVNTQRLRVFPEENQDIYKFSRTRTPFLHPTIAFKKQCVLNVGGYKGLLFFEDYYLFLRMIKANYKCYNIQEDLLYFRGNEESFKRRGGVGYIKHELSAFYIFNKEALIERRYIVINVLGRFLIRILPNSIRKGLYITFLRNKRNLNEGL